MDRHLRLYLKSGGQHRKGLHEPVTERPVTCHDIFDLTVEQPVDAAAHDGVAEVVEGPLILRKICGRQPVTHYHVRIAVKHLVHHPGRVLHRIGIIPVHHDIALRLDLAEHAPDHIALALHVLMPDHCPFCLGQLHGAVAGIVIIHIDHRLRQSRFRVPHHLGDRLLFVITRN